MEPIALMFNPIKHIVHSLPPNKKRMNNVEHVSFREGIDFVLDLANSTGGKISDIKVSDVEPSVVDLHVDINYYIPLKADNIDVKFILPKS